MRDPLNRANGPAIIRLYDACFKRGVIDACEANDDYAVREFISKHKFKWTFGTIKEPDGVDWRSFRFILYRIARETGLMGLSENYIAMIRKTNYLWCLLPYCMWFYLMGAQEWLAYPSVPQIEIFKSHKRVHWDPNCPVKKFTRMDYISYMHEASFEYRKFDDENKPVTDTLMDSYCNAVFDITKSYVSK